MGDQIGPLRMLRKENLSDFSRWNQAEIKKKEHFNEIVHLS